MWAGGVAAGEDPVAQRQPAHLERPQERVGEAERREEEERHAPPDGHDQGQQQPPHHVHLCCERRPAELPPQLGPQLVERREDLAFAGGLRGIAQARQLDEQILPLTLRVRRLDGGLQRGELCHHG